jgi:hypothetical protein
MLFSRSMVGCQTKTIAAAYNLGAATFPHEKPLKIKLGENEAPAHPKASQLPHISPICSKPDIRGKAAILSSNGREISIPDSQLDGKSVGMVLRHLS